MTKLEGQARENKLSPREKKIYSFIESHPGTQSGKVAEKLGLALPTVKRIIAGMVTSKFLIKYGIGKGTNYTIETEFNVKSNVIMKFSDESSKQERILNHRSHFIEINQIILRPHFKWTDPNEWGEKLRSENLKMKVKCTSLNGTERNAEYNISTFIDIYRKDPVFTIPTPINIPGNTSSSRPNDNEFPIKVVIEITSENGPSEFDVELVYDAMLE